MFRIILIRKSDYFPIADGTEDYGLVVLKELILLQFVTRKFYFKGSIYLPNSERYNFGLFMNGNSYNGNSHNQPKEIC
jgi:hypothetical protein